MRNLKSLWGNGLRGRFAVAAMVAAVALVLAAAPAARADEHDAPLAGKHVALLVGEGVHDAETLVPLGYLVNRGAKVTVVGPVAGVVKAYNSDIRVHVEKTVGQVSAADFDALVIPGGRSPANVRQHEAVLDFVRAVAKAGKPIAAICHGPQVLVTAGLLDGRKATCFAGIAGELREAGAEYSDVPLMRDGNIITSRIPQDLPAFTAAIEEALRGSNY
jgi:protease I